MLGNYRVSKQLGISRVVLSSMELVYIDFSKNHFQRVPQLQHTSFLAREHARGNGGASVCFQHFHCVALSVMFRCDVGPLQLHRVPARKRLVTAALPERVKFQIAHLVACFALPFQYSADRFADGQL
jgi:hypothetical protein